MDAELLRQMPTIKEFFALEDDKPLPEGVKVFLEAMSEISFEPSQDIVVCGADCEDGMYIILEGDCEVLNAKGEKINTVLSTGNFIGELGLMNDSPRGATVRAVTKVRCANISRDLFDEIGKSNRKIYGSFMTMLYNRTTKLVTEQQRIRSELEIATRIQDGILEHDFSAFNSLDHVKIKACARPAKEMGGDFYDVFMIDDNRMCFLIADVSGKGVPAAMFMSMAKIHIKNYASLGLPLTEVASRTNDQLCYKNDEGMFVTVFLCVLDLTTNEVSFINAGHDLPYICKKDDSFKMVEAKVNLVFGMMEGVPYKEQKFILEPGEAFYMYTDGVNEAINEKEELYGNERLERDLNSLMSDAADPDKFLDGMYKKIDDYAGTAEQADDITMVYITRKE